VERRVIRAPVSGELADVAVIRPGAVVKEGDRLAAIVPSGGLRLVADYPPASAFGRIRAGQSGQLRLQGFPWTQYGSLPVRVERVAGEVRNGMVRVEMSVDSSASRIPLQHGLPGSVEVEVDRVSPAVLTLRLAGRLAAAPRPANVAAQP
jgi:multidrug resistance efflux pump